MNLILGAISLHHALPHAFSLLAWLNDVGHNVSPLAAAGAAGAGAAGAAAGGDGSGGDPYWNRVTKDGIPYHYGGSPAPGQPPLEPSSPRWWSPRPGYSLGYDHGEPDSDGKVTAVGRPADAQAVHTEESAMKNQDSQ
jgi:hypothetical protein